MFVMFIVVVVLLLCDAIMLMMERCCERLNKTEVHELTNPGPHDIYVVDEYCTAKKHKAISNQQYVISKGDNIL